MNASPMPFTFLLGEKLSMPIGPKFEKGRLFAAYVDGEHVVAIPFAKNSVNFEPSYLSAPIPKGQKFEDYLKNAFRAESLSSTTLRQGECIKNVWRPGFVDTYNHDHNAELWRNAQELNLLTQKLWEIFLTVTPCLSSLRVHGPRIRELHMLACMEVESYLKTFLQEAKAEAPSRPNIRHYMTLKGPLNLGALNIRLPHYPELNRLCPFQEADARSGGQAPAWYRDYNASKHDRRGSGHKSTLQHAMTSVAAACVLFCIRYSPYQLDDRLKTDFIVDFSPGENDVYVPEIKNPLKSAHLIQQYWSSEDLYGWVEIPLEP